MPSRTAAVSFAYSAGAVRHVVLALVAVEGLLVTAYLLLHLDVLPPGWWFSFRNLMDVDQETSIPTWFSAMQLFLAGLAALLLSPRIPRLRLMLVLLGLAFIFLSMDEGAAVHDRLYDAFRNDPSLGGVQYLAWMVPYLVLATCAGGVMWPSLLYAWRQHRHESLAAAVGVAVFLAGGVGLEIVSHLVLAIEDGPLLRLTIAAEEFCEMAGVTAMLYATLQLGVADERERAAAATHPRSMRTAV